MIQPIPDGFPWMVPSYHSVIECNLQKVSTALLFHNSC